MSATESGQVSDVDGALTRLQAFLRLEAAGGLLLMAATVLAIVLANSPLGRYYTAVLDLPFQITLGGAGVAKPVLLWINDGLMAVFFLLVGMELKREVMEGHLSSLRRASLPALAALGGLMAPASIYAAFNWGDPAALRGWAIPAATDIAFALGVLALLGERVPAALKAFLLSVAIFDDLASIIVIALFYTAQLSPAALVAALVLVLAFWGLNRAGIARPAAYLVLGIPLWLAVVKSGVHATLAGVAVAMFIPLRMPPGKEGESPLHRLEHALHPWVTYGILPVFALANAGVSMRGLGPADLLHPVPLGIIAGLLLGKQIGIMAVSGLAVGLKIAALPEGVRWSHLYGTSLVCGIGFTMSLFIASLAFEKGGGVGDSGLDRLGIVTASLLSGLAGYLVLRSCLGSRAQAAPPT